MSGTAANDIFLNNPYICQNKTNFDNIEMHYPLIHKSHIPFHFIQGYVNFLSEMLKLPIELNKDRPALYLNSKEKPKINGKYFLVCSGYKSDYPIKQWHGYQQIINYFKKDITFVQIGENHHFHKPLENTINLIGKTTTRELIILSAFAQGSLSGVTFLHHLMSSNYYIDNKQMFRNPCVIVIASGMEPISWERYNNEFYFNKAASLTCGNQGKGCWKSHLISENTNSLCSMPIITENYTQAKCMEIIKPQEIINIIENCLSGILI